MELMYSGGLHGAEVCGRARLNSGMREGWMELKYMGGLDGAEVFRRAGWSSCILEG